MLVVPDPVFIAFVKACDIVDADALLVLASSLLDLAHEVRYRASEVDQKVRRVYKRHHQVEEVRVVFEVSCAHQSHAVEVRREDARVLVDCAVLDDHFVELGDVDYVLEALVQEVYLEVERPSFHILVEVCKIRVIVY